MKVVSTPKSAAGILGTSIINHKIRVKLGLTLNEYCVLDFLYSRMIAKKPVLSIAKESDALWKDLGVRPFNIVDNVLCLGEKDLIEENKKGEIIPTQLWIDEFEKGWEKEFTTLWDTYGHIGNESEAKARYKLVRKITTLDHLLKRHQVYQKHLDERDWKQKMQLTVWLNPKKMKWDDDYEVQEGDGKQEFSM